MKVFHKLGQSVNESNRERGVEKEREARARARESTHAHIHTGNIDCDEDVSVAIFRHSKDWAAQHFLDGKADVSLVARVAKETFAVNC